MDLVERYLKAVALLLPKAQREDITAELRDLILSRIEARSEALGRPLTDAETEEELHAVGHPIEVASRYRSGPNHAVGPALYPYYVFALKIAIALQLALSAIVLVVRAVSGGDLGLALSAALASAVSGAVMLVGVATIAAMAIEHLNLKPHFLENWKVRDLPLLELGSWDIGAWIESLGIPARPHASTADPTSVGASGDAGAWSSDPHERRLDRRAYRRLARRLRTNPIAYIAGGAVLTLWWVGVLHFFGPHGEAAVRSLNLGAFAQVDLQAVKDAVYAPVLAYGIGLMAIGGFVIAVPGAHRLHAVFILALASLGLAIPLLLWFDSPLTPAIAINSIDDAVGRLQSLFTPHDPRVIEDLIALSFPLNVLIGVQAVMGRLWRVFWPEI
jgi:hypothetical protein